MNHDDRTPRARRARVVVVGYPDGTDALPQTVVRAGNLYDAVGEVTVAPAGSPVDAVVLPAALIRRCAAGAVEAFRRVDPALRLILVASSEDEAAGTGDGFDRVLVRPRADDVARAIDDGEAPAPSIEVVPRPPEPAREARSPEAAPPEPAPVAPPPAEDLGDTDLVEAILAGRGGLRDRALQLAIQQTEWTDLRLEPEAPAGRASAEVRAGRRRFGSLSSSLAGAAALRPWADWLAQWLLLDHRYRANRSAALRDELTGACNRRFYKWFMKRLLRRAARARRPVTVLVFDLDDFKRYNDEYGHDAGDEVLRETVRLLKSVIRAGDRVCRIGGDEFVVIFSHLDEPRSPGSNPPESVEEIAARFQEQICRMKFPKLGADAPGTLSISGGLATYPWDGSDAESLLRHADQLALRSKRKGKNLITIGPAASADS